MSKRRQEVEIVEGDLTSAAEGDFGAYVIFTQLKATGPHIYAGWVDAIDDDMALLFGREHYGQDQACVSVWAIPRSSIAGTEPCSTIPPSPSDVHRRANRRSGFGSPQTSSIVQRRGPSRSRGPDFG